MSNNCLSRAEYSNRQDWSLEVSWELFPLLEPLLDYVVKTLLDDANVLRDSVLIQMECIYFEAYVHVNAILWRVVFRELRALTNGKGPQLSPIALNGLYEYMYDLGLMLQTDTSLSVFDDYFRPWPHIYLDRGRAKMFYKGMDANLQQDITMLRNFEARVDSVKYIGLIRTVLKLFGMGIIDSLTHTMKKYLRQTNGEHANETRSDEEIERCTVMLCHNNNAERPFAVLRQYQRMYSSISLKNLAWLATTLVNGTHSPADKNVDGGIAITAHPCLQIAIGALCSVRRKTPGKITVFIRASHGNDKAEAVRARKRKARQKYDNNVRKKAKRAELRDYAEELCATSLVTTERALQNQLHAHGSHIQGKMKFLREQFHARVSGSITREYPSIGKEFRTKYGKLKLTSSCKTQCKLEYLTNLIKAMIVEDSDFIGINGNKVAEFTQNFIRVVPEISSEFTNPKSVAMKAEFSSEISVLATPIDDPVYILLHEKYSGAILYDFETRSSSKLFRIVAIQFVRSYTATRVHCWEATCEPVFRNSATGMYSVPKDATVAGSNVTMKHALQGYALAEYRAGTDEEPTYLPWVDQYIHHFQTRIQYNKDLPSLSHKDLPSYTSEDLPSSSQDLPSYHLKDLPSNTKKDLPSTRSRKRLHNQLNIT
jgi:hypothetical protein